MSSTVINTSEPAPRRLIWAQLIPYILIHLACFAVLWVGWSPVALIVAGVLYSVRVFALTAFYHRYFSHRAFKTSRIFQFIGAVLANSSLQRGPLWWAAHHRLHHRLSDKPGDLHSPHQDGFLWSHMGWFHDMANQPTNMKAIRDFAKYRELVLLDRFDFVVPLSLGALLYALGACLERWAPGLHTTGLQMFVWGWAISTVAVYHVTYSINSFAHLIGSRRFATEDSSRNSLVLALLTFGEGWHNNHHYYPNAARQGFYWWELDITYSILKMLSWVGIVWDLHAVPSEVLESGRKPATSARGS
jgi:stearoyl-CoA desaturase (delta-9 desaturase)